MSNEKKKCIMWLMRCTLMIMQGLMIFSLPIFDARRSNAAEKESNRKYRKKMRLVGHAIFTCDRIGVEMFNWEIANLWGVEMS